MRICTPSIDVEKGDYLVFNDNGCEGVSLALQAKTLDEAISNMHSVSYGNAQMLVKLVAFSVEEGE